MEGASHSQLSLMVMDCWRSRRRVLGEPQVRWKCGWCV